MRRRLVLAALLLVALVAGRRGLARAVDLGSHAARACPPAAVVDGPPEIVTSIVAILHGHGVGTASSACGPRIVKASLVAQSGARGYELHVLDADGHSSDRQVADATMAATLIESWALDEDADLWVPRPGADPPPGATTAAPAAVAEHGPGNSDAVAAHRTAQVGMTTEMSISRDAAIWWGAGASGCLRVRALCAGVRADVARAETTLVIDRARGIAPDLTRTLSGLSTFAAWPVSAGRFWLAPSLGLGAAWLHSNATQAGVTSTTDDLLARGQAGAASGLTIGKGWSVALGLGGSVAWALRGDGRQGTTTYIPGAPHAFLTAGVGVWYAP